MISSSFIFSKMSVQKIRKKSTRGEFAKPSKLPPAVKPTYEVPSWAGKPPTGMHLDILKEGKLIEKFIVDGKTHFFFGRQRQYIDFTLDHTSCSRVHAVMIYHKNLQRMFLLDLGSTHGTFLGNVQLECERPMQLAIDDTFSFGASTRSWVLRQKPNVQTNLGDTSLNSSTVSDAGGVENDSNLSLLGLPEAENELDDLTEFNTAHNRRMSTLPMDKADHQLKRRKTTSVSFSADGDEVINPEDVDPSVGRFRNLISTEIIVPTKKQKLSTTTDSTAANDNADSQIGKTQDFVQAELYPDLNTNTITSAPSVKSLLPKISSAPDVEEPNKEEIRVPLPSSIQTLFPIEKPQPITSSSLPSTKRKYEKEAWPGRKPKGQNLLSV
jgi:nuclear inhibitor of protein phosphatase 1